MAVADFAVLVTDPSGALRVKDSNDRLVWSLVLVAVFGGLGALVGSTQGAGGALAGAFLGLMLLFGLYLQYRGPL